MNEGVIFSGFIQGGHLVSKKKQADGKQKGQEQQNVVPIGNLNCVFETCKSKSKRFGFCLDHYEQFKFGLIKKNGTKPTDYNEKMKHFIKHTGKDLKAA